MHVNAAGKPSSIGSGSELMRFGRVAEGGRRRITAADHVANFVEVTRADLTLMAGGGVAMLPGSELGLLQLGIRSHAGGLVGVSQLIHGVGEGVACGVP